MATLHLISGLPCAGKSTYAERLTKQRDAVHLSLDRWLITMFGRYPVDTVGHDEHVRRVYACRELIWSVACELLRRGVDVVLDDGFILRADRRHHADRAREIGARTAIHYVATPPEVVRQRLEARNRNPGDHHFEIAPAALEGYISFFEPPGDDEGAELLVVRNASP